MKLETENKGPLAGYRIVDLTRIVMGPMATQMMGDMGADVIKVEEPAGDLARNIGTFRHDGMASCFLNCNRNKRSVCIDLKAPEGLQAMLDLVASADVFIHALRPQAAAKLNVAYEDLIKVNPKLIYVGAYGFSTQGPYGTRTAFDDIIQAASGSASIQGEMLDQPRYVSFIQADKTCGVMACNAVLAALLHRERTGEGQSVELPMFETMVGFNMVEHLDGATYADATGPTGYNRLMTEWRKPYASKDGWVAILPYDDRQWRVVLNAAGRPDLAEDTRFTDFKTRQKNIEYVYSTLSDLAATQTTDEWLAALEPHGVPCTRVNTPQDLLEDPHLQAVGFWQHYDHPTEGELRTMKFPVNFNGSPASLRRPVPLLGEQTREVLAEIGYDADRVEDLMTRGVVKETRAG